MPKEQSLLSEQNPSLSSKNAKDRSNISSASQGPADTDDFNTQGNNCSPQKDSGYSDGSDWYQTDAEEQQRLVNQYRSGGYDKVPEQTQIKDDGHERVESPLHTKEKPMLMPANNTLSPPQITNNTVLKQPMDVQNGTSPLQAKLIWGSTTQEGNISEATSEILLPQPKVASTLSTSPCLHKPLSCRINSTERKNNGTYFPILNTYPRIAPHPTKNLLDKKLPSFDSQSLSKMVCNEDEWSVVSTTSSLTKHHPRNKIKSRVLTFSRSNSNYHVPSSTTTVSYSLCSSSNSSLGASCSTASSLHSLSSPYRAAKGLHRTGLSCTRRRRFLNTVEILRQSGLLDITLRTQELLRQNNATRRDIVQLRQNTQLLCQAASNTLGSDIAWKKLCQVMVQSGEHPTLTNLTCEKTHPAPETGGQANHGSSGDTDSQAATFMSDMNQNYGVPNISSVNGTCVPCVSEQGREYKACSKPSEIVTIMPPDSSTDGGVLYSLLFDAVPNNGYKTS